MELKKLISTGRSVYLYALTFQKNQKWLRCFSLTWIISLCLIQNICAQYPPIHWHTQAVDSYFSKLEAFGLSGSLLIGTKDKVLLRKDYGNQTSSKSNDLAYLVGSISKQFTATAILLLEQRGFLNTNEPISTYLSNLPSDKSEITIHQLLTHTSGLKDDYWDQHRDLSEDAYIEKMLAEDLLSKPGSRFRYANFGYHLLSKIIESVSKKDYERFLNEELFRPFGLFNTGFNMVDWQQNQVAQYTDWSTEGSEQILRNPLDRPIYLQPEGSGGLLSTTGDLYKWYQLIFHSEKLLSANSKQKLLTTEKANYACGWEVYQTNRGSTLIEHGGFDTWVGLVTGFYNFIDEDLVVIFLGNTHMSKLLQKDDLMKNIEALIFGGQVQMPPGPAIHQNTADISKYFGVYKTGAKSISISKGKVKNNLRLRTTDQAIIQQLLFPGLSDAEKRTDVQLEYILNNIKDDKYEPLKDHFIEEVPFDVLKQTYRQTWKQLTGSMGQYKGFQVLHTISNIFEGKFELQLFIALEFEHGIFHLRAFRNYNGRIHLQPLRLPERLEIFLSPTADKATYKFWNIKSGLSSTITIQENSLSINGKEEMVYKKKLNRIK